MNDLFYILKKLIPGSTDWRKPENPKLAWEFVMECWDKRVTLPIANYMIEDSLLVTKGGEYNMEGQGSHERIYWNETQGRQISRNTAFASIMPLHDFDVIKVQTSEDVIFNGGNINTAFAPDHSSAGILYDPDYKIFGGEVNDLWVEGRYYDVRKPGVGTKAIEIKTRDLKNQGAHVSNIDFSGVKFKYCAAGLIAEARDESAYKVKFFINEFNLDIETWGCKQAVSFQSLDDNPNFKILAANGRRTSKQPRFGVNMIEGKIEAHDFPVLSSEEEHLYLVEIMGKQADISISIHDNGKAKNNQGYRPHWTNLLKTYRNEPTNRFYIVADGKEIKIA